MTSIIIIFSVALLLIYVFRLNHFSAFEDYQHEVSSNQENFTIVIPFKNEVAHLDSCYKAIKALEYPQEKLEVIFVDDHSTDASVDLVSKLINQHENFILKTNRGRGKKFALETGVSVAKNKWIISLDADCIPQPNLCKNYTEQITPETQLIAGAVILKPSTSNTWLFSLLNLEHLALQRLTYLSIRKKQPLMANGGNLAFKKDLFIEAFNESMNLTIASGDDTFLLFHASRKYPNGIASSTSANSAVFTSAPANYKQATAQRIRWASKLKAKKTPTHIYETGFLLFLTNLAFLILFIASAKSKLMFVFFVFWFIKSVSDFYFIKPVAGRFEQKMPFSQVFLLNLIYPVFLLDIFVRSAVAPLKKKQSRDENYRGHNKQD